MNEKEEMIYSSGYKILKKDKRNFFFFYHFKSPEKQDNIIHYVTVGFESEGKCTDCNFIFEVQNSDARLIQTKFDWFCLVLD